MKIEQFRRLKKYMMMTMSGAEAEVLMAIRKANEAVVEAGTDWNKILDRVVQIETPIESVEVATGRSSEPSAIAIRRAAHIKKVEEAFATIEESDPRGTWADFIADLKSQWERSGRLSENQLEALFKGARNSGNRR